MKKICPSWQTFSPSSRWSQKLDLEMLNLLSWPPKTIWNSWFVWMPTKSETPCKIWLKRWRASFKIGPLMWNQTKRQRTRRPWWSLTSLTTFRKSMMLINLCSWTAGSKHDVKRSCWTSLLSLRSLTSTTLYSQAKVSAIHHLTLAAVALCLSSKNCFKWTTTLRITDRNLVQSTRKSRPLAMMESTTYLQLSSILKNRY